MLDDLGKIVSTNYKYICFFAYTGCPFMPTGLYFQVYRSGSDFVPSSENFVFACRGKSAFYTILKQMGISRYNIYCLEDIPEPHKTIMWFDFITYEKYKNQWKAIKTSASLRGL